MRSYDELLEREDLDIVSCTTENARHAEVVEAAAARGLHVLVEKPMAASLAQAERMVAAASFAGVKLFLNWPSSWQPPLQHAIKLAREGFIGQVYEARYRGGHTGPRDLGCSPYFYSWLYDAELNGGGASADYLGYGTGFVYDVLGMPSAVVGLAGRLVQDFITVDDNARLLLEYHRAMALVEGSWTQARPLPGAAAICGTEGNLVVEYGGDLTLYIAAARTSRSRLPRRRCRQAPAPAPRPSSAPSCATSRSPARPAHSEAAISRKWSKPASRPFAPGGKSRCHCRPAPAVTPNTRKDYRRDAECRMGERARICLIVVRRRAGSCMSASATPSPRTASSSWPPATRRPSSDSCRRRGSAAK